MKVCTKCNQEKPFEKFPVRKGSKDGYNGVCRECKNAQTREWHHNNPDWLKSRRAAYQKSFVERHPEKIKEYSRKQNKKHRQRKTESARLWRHKNPNKVRESNKRNSAKQKEWAKENITTVRKAQKEWRTRNPDKIAANGAVRRARKVQATPPWLTKEHKQEIVELYRQARTLKEFHEVPFHVDHIEPLKGVNENGEHIASGLHVPWNLQVLTESENCKKSNKLKIKNLN